MSGSPMDPERLARLREQVEGLAGVTADRPLYSADTMGELLDDRDHWEAETKDARAGADALDEKATRLTIELSRQQGQYRERIRELEAAHAEVQRYRSRCPVTAEDDDTQTIGAEALRACLTRHRWIRVQHVGNIERWKFDDMNCVVIIDNDIELPACVAAACNTMAPLVELCPLDILDEMAKEPACAL